MSRIHALRLCGNAVWITAGVFGASLWASYGVLSRHPAQPSPVPVASAPPAALSARTAAARRTPLGPPLPAALAERRDAGSGVAGGTPILKVLTGNIQGGGTLGSSLGAQGVSPRLVDLITHKMRPVFDFRHAQPGDFFALVTGEEGRLLSFEYQRGRSTIYKLHRGDDGELQASRAQVPLERHVVQLGGVVDHSLFEAIRAEGEGPELAQAFADIFVWDFDFSTQTRPGDEFRLVVEKYYDRDRLARYGDILAARYQSGGKQFTALYFEEGDGYGDYYTPEGNSVRRTFLRAPVKYSHISSRYSKSRLHPILKVRRPHEGIDYAAPAGTPVWAVADGTVIFKGWAGGFGRQVRIRHNNGYTSCYGHLSSYAPGLAVGRRVRQKQVIGRVGRSGLATGPHLDYRLRVDGRFVDPLRVRFPKGRPVPVRSWGRFEQVREMRLAQLRETQPPVVLEAAM